MILGSSFLAAVARAGCHAVVMQTGERPYVVTEEGLVPIGEAALTLAILEKLLAHLAPASARDSLHRSGAVDVELPVLPGLDDDRFTLMAVRVGDGLRVEILRHPPAVRSPAVHAPRPTLRAPRGRAPMDRVNHPAATVDDLVDLAAVNGAWPETGDVGGWPASGSPESWPPTRAHVPQGPPSAPLELFEPTALSATSELTRLLVRAANRGASVLYITAWAQPAIRVAGEVQILDDEPSLGGDEAESLLLEAMPRGAHSALHTGVRIAWISNVPGVGRVRCRSFTDVRGASGVFRINSARPLSVEQLGLSREVRALALEPEGLVLVSSRRSSGTSTVIGALVDLINRRRRVYVITVESEIEVTHDPHGCMVSQREVHGDSRELLAAARLALHDDPDVLAIEDLVSDAIAELSLDVAGSGRLVIAGLTAHTAVDAVNVFVNKYAAGRRQRARALLAEHLRGIVVDVPLPRIGAGRASAREVLLNTPAVAAAIASGDDSSLLEAVNAGEPVGMVSLNRALASLVRTGDVDLRDAYLTARDREGFVDLLKASGIDTSPLEA